MGSEIQTDHQDGGIPTDTPGPRTSYRFRDILPGVKVNNREAILAAYGPIATNLWFHGDAGQGKTHIAKCTMERAKAAGKTAVLLTGQVFREIGESFDRQEAFARYIYADLVVVDDIDKCAWTMKAVESLWYFLDCRSKWKKHVIVTANVTPAGMLEILKAATGANPSMAFTTLDRLHPCRAFHIQAGVSLRRGQAMPVLDFTAPPEIETISATEAAEVRAAIQCGALHILARGANTNPGEAA